MISSRKQERQMKRLTMITLLVNLAIASAYPQRPVKLTFAGTGGASPIDLKLPNTRTVEEDVAGNGSLGTFTFRGVRATANGPGVSSTCTGLFFPSMSGAALMRFQDGSVLTLNLTAGGDCIDLVHLVGHCTLTFTITGGTGRFKNASGVLTYTETALPLAGDGMNPVFFSETGDITGTISGVDNGENSQDGQQQDGSSPIARLR
jgi:hypothetical protein